MTLYCNSSWQTALQQQQLATFDQIWDFPIQWIDTPNQNRGGWSGVGCLELLLDEQPVTLFVKKQLNHTTRTWLHPLQGVPTFTKEYHTIRYLQGHGVVAPNVVFFAQRRTVEGQQAILITENLACYQPLDSLNKDTMSLLQQRRLLSCISQTIRRMHQLGIQHRAIYAKHSSVKPHEQSFEIAMIDLAKARRMVALQLQSSFDLITVNYRTQGWNKASRLVFLKYYLDQDRLNRWGKLFCGWIIYRTAHKHDQWKKKYE